MRIPYNLSVCSEMVFTDRPLIERVERIRDAGFGVEIWDWSGRDIDALAATGARFTSRTGYLRGDTPFAAAADCLALVEAVDSPHLKLMLDLYHAQIGEGNLIALIRRCGDAVGEVQVADVPGRREPGTGEINYPAIARALVDLGYSGVVGLEAFAAADPDLALERFREAFTV